MGFQRYLSLSELFLAIMVYDVTMVRCFLFCLCLYAVWLINSGDIPRSDTLTTLKKGTMVLLQNALDRFGSGVPEEFDRAALQHQVPPASGSSLSICPQNGG